MSQKTYTFTPEDKLNIEDYLRLIQDYFGIFPNIMKGKESEITTITVGEDILDNKNTLYVEFNIKSWEKPIKMNNTTNSKSMEHLIEGLNLLKNNNKGLNVNNKRNISSSTSIYKGNDCTNQGCQPRDVVGKEDPLNQSSEPRDVLRK